MFFDNSVATGIWGGSARPEEKISGNEKIDRKMMSRKMGAGRRRILICTNEQMMIRLVSISEA